MPEDELSKSSHKLVIISGRPELRTILYAALIIFAIIALASGIAAPRDPSGTIVILLVVLCILILKATRQWIAEVDQTTRRLTIYIETVDHGHRVLLIR